MSWASTACGICPRGGSSSAATAPAASECHSHTLACGYCRNPFLLCKSTQSPPGCSWHVDPLNTSAWNALMTGTKRWALHPPSVTHPLGHPGVRCIRLRDACSLSLSGHCRPLSAIVVVLCAIRASAPCCHCCQAQLVATVCFAPLVDYTHSLTHSPPARGLGRSLSGRVRLGPGVVGPHRQATSSLAQTERVLPRPGGEGVVLF